MPGVRLSFLIFARTRALAMTVLHNHAASLVQVGWNQLYDLVFLILFVSPVIADVHLRSPLTEQLKVDQPFHTVVDNRRLGVLVQRDQLERLRRTRSEEIGRA